jgi:hypothetical protein
MAGLAPAATKRFHNPSVSQSASIAAIDFAVIFLDFFGFFAFSRPMLAIQS